MVKSTGQKLIRDERGTILPVIAVMLGLFCGLMALTFDVGRIGVTHSEQQVYADHLALAAAGELDLRDDAITRATNAAVAMIEDYRTFGDGGGDFATADYTLTFYSNLPTDDTAPIPVSMETSLGTQAKYVGVSIRNMDAGYVFSRIFALMTGQQEINRTTAASSIAEGPGLGYVCDVAPLMFCIPDPATSTTPQNQLWSAEKNIGQMVRLRSTGNDAWGPGDFGFLDIKDVTVSQEAGAPCRGLTSTQKVRCLIAAEGGLGTCLKGTVDTDPGQSVGIEIHAFNTVFDIWQGNLSGKKGLPGYKSAPHVLKGMIPNGGSQCVGNSNSNGNGNGNKPVSDAVVLPRDACLANGTCQFYGDHNVVTGQTSVALNWTPYMNANHSVPVDKNDLSQGYVSSVDPRDTHGLSSNHKWKGTRYEMYLAEIAMLNDPLLKGANGKPDTGSPLLDGDLNESVLPQCQSASAASTRPERRQIIVAAVNCDKDHFLGQEIKGKTTGVRVHEYVRMFLTEPVNGTGSDKFIYAEVLGTIGQDEGGTGTISREAKKFSQLVRSRGTR